MEDFYDAGGLRALLNQLARCLATCTWTGHGQRQDARGEIAGGGGLQRRGDPLPEQALLSEGGVAVLRGNLAPDGAVIKPTAAEPRLLNTPGRRWSSKLRRPERHQRPGAERHGRPVLVLRNAGPRVARACPMGHAADPQQLLKQGVRDMVRISDARMSGTSYGACVLHVAPESVVGGPLALVREGDLITLDAAARELHLDVTDEELAARRAAWKPPSRSSSGATVSCSPTRSRRPTRAATSRSWPSRAATSTPTPDNVTITKGCR